ncbi:MAG: hypothetical protein ABI395_08330 [Sphingobium sp.]
MEEFGLESDDISDLLGNHYAGILFGCALEDLMTRRFEPDGLNLVDDYLKRRGWNESVPTKSYMRAIRDSAFSLYEISEIVPGQSFLASDLVRGGEPVKVTERTATRTLQQWDKIGSRIVPEGKGHVLSGALLPFSHEGADTLLSRLRTAEGKRSKASSIDLDDEMLAGIAPMFTAAWLFDVLTKALGLVKPHVVNSDGDKIMLHRVRFPLARGKTHNDIAKLLDTESALHRENTHFWNWVQAVNTGARGTNKPKGLMMRTTNQDGETVLGNLELQGRALFLSANSAKRAALGTALLSKLLGVSVGTPLTEIETIEQAMAARGGQSTPSSEIPPEVATPLVHAMLDKQYRAILDEPVGMIGDITPRAASKTTKGRARLVEWLKFLENRSGYQAEDTDPMATYDFIWMWRELGIEKLRK